MAAWEAEDASIGHVNPTRHLFTDSLCHRLLKLNFELGDKSSQRDSDDGCVSDYSQCNEAVLSFNIQRHTFSDIHWRRDRICDEPIFCSVLFCSQLNA